MIEIRILGPDYVGAPTVGMSAGGRYSPDVAHDLKNRAVEAYRELFGDLTAHGGLDVDAVETQADVEQP